MNDPMQNPIFEWVQASEISYNPVQEKLFPERTRINVGKLKKKFEEHYHSKGTYFRGDRILTVRHAAQGEKGRFVILEGARRLAASKLIEETTPVPVYVDEEAKPENDLYCLLQIVKKLEWEGFNHWDISKVVKEWVEQEEKKWINLPDWERETKEKRLDEAIKSEFGKGGAELARRYLAFAIAPQYIVKAVLDGDIEFTPAARIVASVYQKPKDKPEFKLYEWMLPDIAEAIMKSALETKKDPASHARRLRKEVKNGRLVLSNGELVKRQEP